MKKIVIALLSVFALAFVDVARADQVRFFSVMPDGVEYSQDIHYTVLTLEGVKVADNTVEDPYGVTINDLPLGTYFLSAEQPSTGYYGSRQIEITGDEFIMVHGEKVKDDENKLLLGPDGLTKYVHNYPYENEILRAQELVGDPSCGCQVPAETSCQPVSPCSTCQNTCAIPRCEASYCCGTPSFGSFLLIPPVIIPIIPGMCAEAK